MAIEKNLPGDMAKDPTFVESVIDELADKKKVQNLISLFTNLNHYVIKQ